MTEGEFAVIHAEVERETMRNYKSMLISEIVKLSNNKFTEDSLKGKTIRTLERIYDNC